MVKINAVYKMNIKMTPTICSNLFAANQHSMDLQVDVAGDADDPEQLGRLVVGGNQRPGRHGRSLLDSRHYHSRFGEKENFQTKVSVSF